MAGCSGGDSGATSLFAALRGNDQLQLLDVRGVPVGPEVSVCVTGVWVRDVVLSLDAAQQLSLVDTSFTAPG